MPLPSGVAFATTVADIHRKIMQLRAAIALEETKNDSVAVYRIYDYNTTIKALEWAIAVIKENFS